MNKNEDKTRKSININLNLENDKQPTTEINKIIRNHSVDYVHFWHKYCLGQTGKTVKYRSIQPQGTTRLPTVINESTL